MNEEDEDEVNKIKEFLETWKAQKT